MVLPASVIEEFNTNGLLLQYNCDLTLTKLNSVLGCSLQLHLFSENLDFIKKLNFTQYWHLTVN